MEGKKRYKVTNKAKDVRKFRDRFLGKDIFIEPKKFILTDKPPEENDIWKVEDVEKLEKKNQLNVPQDRTNKEVKKMDVKNIKNGSSSNR